MQPLETVEVEPDFTTFLLYQGRGYTVYENRDTQMDDTTWFTVMIKPQVSSISDAMRYFAGDEADIIDVEFDGEHIYLDVAVDYA